MSTTCTLKWFQRKRAALVPLGFMAVLAVFYGFSLYFFKCTDKARCREFKVEEVFTLNEKPLIANDGNVVALAADIQSHKDIAARYAGRLTWIFLGAVLVLLCLTAAALVVQTLFKKSSVLSTDKCVVLAIAILAVISAGIGWALFLYPNSHMPIMKGVLDSTISKSAISQLGMPTVVWWERLLNALTFASAIALIGVTCATLFPFKKDGSNQPPASESDAKLALDVVAGQMRRLRRILYIGTLLLIAGVLRQSALYQWAVAFVDPVAQEAAKNFGDSALAVTGGLYTIVIAAMYLPAAQILQWRVDHILSKSQIKEENVKAILEYRDLGFSFYESLPQAAAVLGPFLAGPLAVLLKALPTYSAP